MEHRLGSVSPPPPSSAAPLQGPRPMRRPRLSAWLLPCPLAACTQGSQAGYGPAIQASCSPRSPQLHPPPWETRILSGQGCTHPGSASPAPGSTRWRRPGSPASPPPAAAPAPAPPGPAARLHLQLQGSVTQKGAQVQQWSGRSRPRPQPQWRRQTFSPSLGWGGWAGVGRAGPGWGNGLGRPPSCSEPGLGAGPRAWIYPIAPGVRPGAAAWGRRGRLAGGWGGRDGDNAMRRVCLAGAGTVRTWAGG